MEISIGFIILLVVILFPGLLFRRMYFYGEFSKQFNSNYGLPRLLAVSAIPGVIITCISFGIYHIYFTPIDLASLVNSYKDVVNPEFRIEEVKPPLKIGVSQLDFNSAIYHEITKFIAFEYLIAFIFGTLAGRGVRFSNLDTRFKILRFENYWFYAFSGQCERFEKFKEIKNNGKQHVFTKADILVNTNSGAALYSGIVVDYELKEQEVGTLSKVYLQNAQRYKNIKGKNRRTDIPGQILVVDCNNMCNINLTYIYTDQKTFLESSWPSRIEIVFSLVMIALIPCFIFQASWLQQEWYLTFLNFSLAEKILSYFCLIQGLGIIMPIVRTNDGYTWISKKLFGLKLGVFVILGVLLFWII